MDSMGNSGSGQFLQVSGLKIIFDVRRPPGDRLLQVLQGVLDRDSPITAQVEGRIILVKDGMNLNEVGVNLETQGTSLASGLASGLPEALLLLASVLLASL